MNTFLFGNAKSKAMIVARIAIMMTLTVLVQYLTGLVGIQLLTGSFVNLFLLLSVMMTGIVGGICVGMITPFIALLLGLNPLLVLCPFIALANTAFVVCFALIIRLLNSFASNSWKRIITLIAAAVIAALVKFLLMLLISRVIFPLFLAEAMVAKLATAWGVLQFFTALIGGAVAIVLYFPLRKVNLVGYENKVVNVE